MIAYVQTDNVTASNVGCSGATLSDVTATGRLATAGAAAGSGEAAFDPGNNVTRACFRYLCGPAPGVASWAAGTWVIPLNFTTMDAGTQLVGVYVCDLNGTVYTTVASNTSPGHTRGATGILTVNVTQGSAHTPQSQANSVPAIILVFNNSDAHGGSNGGITSNQTITAPIVLATPSTPIFGARYRSQFYPSRRRIF